MVSIQLINSCAPPPHLGIDRIHKATGSYIKSISKRSEGDDKEKTLPIAHLGSSMVGHGEDFDANSDYGRCMTSKPTQMSNRIPILMSLLHSAWKG